MIHFSLTRIGAVMTPDPDEPREACGVLNPASARSRDGSLYLFPRVVAEGNLSRIAMGRVSFDAAGNPVGVQRLGSAVVPHGSVQSPRGVEDPRITYLPLLDRYVMVYTDLAQDGTRIALAASHDLFAWSRLGPVRFGRFHGVDLDRYGNKDGVLFPDPVLDPAGHPAFALLHRPDHRTPLPDGQVAGLLPPAIEDARPGIWIAYFPVDRVLEDVRTLTCSVATELLAGPQRPWEALKIGAGPPPVLSEQGWLLFYHGVSGNPEGRGPDTKAVRYQMGAMLLDRDDPRRVLDRSAEPLLSPAEPNEIDGRVPDVVFPTAVDVRGRRLDIYYGAGDSSIAVASTHLSTPIYQAPSAPALTGHSSR